MGKTRSFYLEQDSILDEFPIGNAFELFDQIKSVVHFIYNLKSGKFLHLSNSVEKVLGYPVERFFEEGIEFFVSAIYEEDFPTVFQAYCDCVEEINTPYFDNCNYYSRIMGFRIKHGLGHWIWIEIDFVLFDFKGGKSSKLFGIIKDVSKSNESRRVPCKMGQENQNPESEVQKLRIHRRIVLYGGDDYRSTDFPIEISLRTNMCKEVTRREKEVLKLIADGLSAKEVANKLFISIHTAINHRKNLITKFHVKNTAELIKVASKYFWL